MPFFRSLPPEAGVRHILQLNKPACRALIQLHEALMRSDSTLTAAQHEEIAAYVSRLNACKYCYRVHAETLKAFDAPRDPRLEPILAYASGRCTMRCSPRAFSTS